MADVLASAVYALQAARERVLGRRDGGAASGASALWPPQTSERTCTTSCMSFAAPPSVKTALTVVEAASAVFAVLSDLPPVVDASLARTHSQSLTRAHEHVSALCRSQHESSLAAALYLLATCYVCDAAAKWYQSAVRAGASAPPHMSSCVRVCVRVAVHLAADAVVAARGLLARMRSSTESEQFHAPVMQMVSTVSRVLLLVSSDVCEDTHTHIHTHTHTHTGMHTASEPHAAVAIGRPHASGHSHSAGHARHLARRIAVEAVPVLLSCTHTHTHAGTWRAVGEALAVCLCVAAATTTRGTSTVSSAGSNAISERANKGDAQVLSSAACLRLIARIVHMHVDAVLANTARAPGVLPRDLATIDVDIAAAVRSCVAETSNAPVPPLDGADSAPPAGGITTESLQSAVSLRLQALSVCISECISSAMHSERLQIGAGKRAVHVDVPIAALMQCMGPLGDAALLASLGFSVSQAHDLVRSHMRVLLAIATHAPAAARRYRAALLQSFMQLLGPSAFRLGSNEAPPLDVQLMALSAFASVAGTGALACPVAPVSACVNAAVGFGVWLLHQNVVSPGQLSSQQLVDIVSAMEHILLSMHAGIHGNVRRALDAVALSAWSAACSPSSELSSTSSLSSTAPIEAKPGLVDALEAAAPNEAAAATAAVEDEDGNIRFATNDEDDAEATNLSGGRYFFKRARRAIAEVDAADDATSSAEAAAWDATRFSQLAGSVRAIAFTPRGAIPGVAGPELLSALTRLCLAVCTCPWADGQYTPYLLPIQSALARMPDAHAVTLPCFRPPLPISAEADPLAIRQHVAARFRTRPADLADMTGRIVGEADAGHIAATAREYARVPDGTAVTHSAASTADTPQQQDAVPVVPSQPAPAAASAHTLTHTYAVQPAAVQSRADGADAHVGTGDDSDDDFPALVLAPPDRR